MGERTKPWSLFSAFRYFRKFVARLKSGSQPQMLLIWSSSLAHLLEAVASRGAAAPA